MDAIESTVGFIFFIAIIRCSMSIAHRWVSFWRLTVCVCSNANWKHRKTKQLKRSELVIHQQKKCDFNLNSSTWKARRKYALQVYIILIWYLYMMIFIYDDIQLEHTIWSMPPFHPLYWSIRVFTRVPSTNIHSLYVWPNGRSTLTKWLIAYL